MARKQLNITASICAVICVVSIFVAVERYNTNVANVEAMNQMQGSSPFAALHGGVDLKPAMPAASKYAILFAALSGIGGVLSLAKSRALVSTA